MNGSVIGWVVLVGVGWCAAAVGVAITIGGVVRLRDRQVPRRDPVRDPVRPPHPAPPDEPVAGIPAPRRAPESLPRPAELDRELPGR